MLYPPVTKVHMTHEAMTQEIFECPPFFLGHLFGSSFWVIFLGHFFKSFFEVIFFHERESNNVGTQARDPNRRPNGPKGTRGQMTQKTK